MSFKDFIGNEQIIQLIKNVLRHQRLSHALLFAGPEGVGKKRLALELAKYLNCQSPDDYQACDQCWSCRKIASGNHLDVQVIAPEEGYLRIDRMRRLREEIYFHPFEGRERTFIIDEAEKMRVEAANSILKTLEEPPEHAKLILISPNPHALLPTIRSRCQYFRFNPVSDRAIAELLASGRGVTKAEAELIAKLSQGSVGKALSFNLSGFKELRNTVLQTIENALVSKSFLRVNKMALNVAKDRKSMETWLELIFLLLRDLLVMKLFKDKRFVINSDMEDRLKTVAMNINLNKLQQSLDKVAQTRRNLENHVNAQLAFEVLFLELMEQA